MKKYVLFFALLITVGGAGAQNTTNRDMAVDTVDCSNAPYMFNPMPPQVSLNNCGTGSMWIGPVGSRQHLGTVAVRYFSHKATIFGVAATMDTFSEPRYNTTGVLPDSTMFTVDLLRLVETIHGQNYESMSLEPVASSSFDKLYKQCAFTFEYTHQAERGDSLWDTRPPNPGRLTTKCYEFYFDHPVSLDESFADTFFVGDMNYIRPSPYPVIEQYRLWYKNGLEQQFIQSWSNPVYSYMTPGSSYFDNHGQKQWFGLFPIIGFRCTPPKYMSMEEQADSSALLRWQGHIDAEVYQVAAGTAGGNPDNMVTATVSGDSTTWLLDSIYLDTAATAVYARKGCRFTTAGYDTLVWSAWAKVNDVRYLDTTGNTAVPQVQTLEQMVNVQPNPAAERVKVTVSCGLTLVEAYDMAGNKVYAQPTEGTTATLDVSTWPTGTYILKLQTPLGSASRRLVVAR